MSGPSVFTNINTSIQNQSPDQQSSRDHGILRKKKKRSFFYLSMKYVVGTQ